MATYEHNTVLSKVLIDGTIYYLKDADLREAVEDLETAVSALTPGGQTLGSAAYEDVATTISSNEDGLTTGAQVYNYVSNAISNIDGALNFKPGTKADQTDPQAGDVVVEGTKEYLYNGSNWIELGDEGLWVPNTRTLAGIDLQDNITKQELITALELKSLAFADGVSITLDDYVTGITGASYTPAGDVAITEDTVNGFDLDITNSASAVTVNTTPTQVLSSIDTAAVAPTFVEGAFTPASLTYDNGNFAKSGISVRPGTGDQNDYDTETLIFESVITSPVITAFSGGAKAADTFTAGSAATFSSTNVIGSITSATADAQTVSYKKFGSSFSGTQDTITPTLVKGEKTVSGTPTVNP